MRTLLPRRDPDGDVRLAARIGHHWLTRRRLRSALGVVWIVDGALQLQPFMFGTGFSHQLSAAGEGQPWPVPAVAHLTAQLVVAHPAPWNAVFAVIQLALGAFLLFGRRAAAACAASIAWAGGVWLVGEGAGGVAHGVNLITGGPGAAALYAVVSLAAWPSSRPLGSRWLPRAWAVLWAAGALTTAVAGVDALASAVSAGGDGAPGPLAWLSRTTGSVVAHAGWPVLAMVVAAQIAIAAGALAGGRSARVAAYAGIAFAVAAWVLGQGLGQIYSGQATDPNSGPLLVLLAAALAAGTRAAARRSARTAARTATTGPSARLAPLASAPAGR